VSDPGRESVSERKRAAGASDIGVIEKMLEATVAPSKESAVGGTAREMTELAGRARPRRPENEEDKDSESTESTEAEQTFGVSLSGLKSMTYQELVLRSHNHLLTLYRTL